MITQQQLETIWTQANGDMDAACQLLDVLLDEVPIADRWNELMRCRPILAAMRDA